MTKEEELNKLKPYKKYLNKNFIQKGSNYKVKLTDLFLYKSSPDFPVYCTFEGEKTGKVNIEIIQFLRTSDIVT